MVERTVTAVESAVGPLPAAVRQSFSVALATPGLRRVSTLAEVVGMQPRRLARVCERAGLAPPKHWLLLAHAVQISAALTRHPSAAFSDIAAELEYPDEFSLSRAMRSGLGCRLCDLRGEPRSSAVIARWIRRHAATSSPENVQA